MARGQSQRSSASVRSEFGEEKTTPKNVAKLASAFNVNIIQPNLDGSFGINYDAVYGSIKDIVADEKGASIITDIIEHSYLKSAKELTLSEARDGGELTPALTRTVNGRYDPKIKELESSIADELKGLSNARLREWETTFSQLAKQIDYQKTSSGGNVKMIGVYKQGDVKKLFNDIYDTLNS